MWESYLCTEIQSALFHAQAIRTALCLCLSTFFFVFVFFCLCVCVCVYVSVCTCVCISLCACVFLCRCIYIYICVCVCVCVWRKVADSKRICKIPTYSLTFICIHQWFVPYNLGNNLACLTLGVSDKCLQNYRRTLKQKDIFIRAEDATLRVLLCNLRKKAFSKKVTFTNRNTISVVCTYMWKHTYLSAGGCMCMH